MAHVPIWAIMGVPPPQWGGVVGGKEVKQVAMYNQKRGYQMIHFNQCGQLNYWLILQKLAIEGKKLQF